MRHTVLRTIALILLSLPATAFADTTYVVKKGDSLAKIAKAHRVSVEQITAANKLASNALDVGDKLRIPKETKKAGQKAEKAVAKAEKTATKAEKILAKTAPAEKNKKKAENRKDEKVAKAAKNEKTAKKKNTQPSQALATAAANSQIHLVQSKDSIFALSRTYGVSEKEIRSLNALKPKAVLKPGMQLVIRKALPESYKVAKGDTLDKIAARFGLDADALAEINGLGENGKLSIGTTLNLADRGAPETAKVEKWTPSVSEEELLDASQPVDGEVGDGETQVERLVRVAKMMLATPYRFGGTTLKGFDCSGYVRKTFSLIDMELPRSAREQYRIGEDVPKSQLSVGDLVFFRTYAKYPSHVGIYLGGNRFIHASSRNHEVEIASLDLPYYQKRYIGAKRVLAGESEERRVL